jgi:G:T-mismatch repair DNA endonuclease (very short patch repair protein)
MDIQNNKPNLFCFFHNCFFIAHHITPAVQMPNAKTQISKQMQITNEMPKQVRHDKGVILNSFQNLILNFDIHLTFACLPVGRDFEI